MSNYAQIVVDTEVRRAMPASPSDVSSAPISVDGFLSEVVRLLVGSTALDFFLSRIPRRCVANAILPGDGIEFDA